MVPVTTSQPNGEHTQITSTVGDGQAPDQDSLSVLGQFSVNTEAGSQSSKILLGEFFATGLAAQELADGFATQLGLQSEPEAPPADGAN